MGGYYSRAVKKYGIYQICVNICNEKSPNSQRIPESCNIASKNLIAIYEHITAATAAPLKLFQ